MAPSGRQRKSPLSASILLRLLTAHRTSTLFRQPWPTSAKRYERTSMTPRASAIRIPPTYLPRFHERPTKTSGSSKHIFRVSFELVATGYVGGFNRPFLLL